MTPAARIQAAIQILDQVIDGAPAEATLLRWARASRFAGSGDRAAVRDLVFDSLRRRNSRAALGGSLTGRGLMLGMCRDSNLPAAELFTGQRHAPPPLTPDELAMARQPDTNEALDLPPWLIAQWRVSLGAQAEQVAMMMRDRAPVWLRANLARADLGAIRASLLAEGIDVQPADQLPTALRVIRNERRVASSTAYRDGLVELQDLSAQLACSELPVAGRILDYCAGGGGKALALAAMGAADITAHDADLSRMQDLPARAKRAGARIRVVPRVSADDRFDLVLADVPCSGSGTWRRTPDAKWRLTAPKLDGLLRVQSEILDCAARMLPSGGHLAYMTCSVLEAENSAQIQAFMRRDGHFHTVKERYYLPPDASDGFYLHLLRRC